MGISTMVTVVSLVLGVVSITLALFTMYVAREAQSETRENFQSAKDVLADVKKESGVIRAVVDTSQKQLLDSMRGILHTQFGVSYRATPREKTDQQVIEFITKDPENALKSEHLLMKFFESRESEFPKESKEELQ